MVNSPLKQPTPCLICRQMAVPDASLVINSAISNITVGREVIGSPANHTLLPFAGKLSSAVSETTGRPQIKITVSGYRIHTLVDSGACLSVMQLSTFNAWASALNKSVHLTPAAPSNVLLVNYCM